MVDAKLLSLPFLVTVLDLGSTQNERTPINLRRRGEETIIDSNLGQLRFSPTYFKPILGHWMVDNYTVSFYPNTSQKLIMSGGIYKEDEYEFLQLHMHYGCNDIEGSEHAIDGVRASMEMHFVHYKRAYGSPERAMKKRDGLAVLGILFRAVYRRTERSGGQDPLAKLNIDKDIKAKNVPELERKVKKVATPTLMQVSQLMPQNITGMRYFAYNGSLTTGDMNEIVIWTVLEEIQPIDSELMNALRFVNSTGGTSMCGNFIRLNPVGARKIRMKVVAQQKNSTRNRFN